MSDLYCCVDCERVFTRKDDRLVADAAEDVQVLAIHKRCPTCKDKRATVSIPYSDKFKL